MDFLKSKDAKTGAPQVHGVRAAAAALARR